jgi:hypothetical protein
MLKKNYYKIVFFLNKIRIYYILKKEKKHWNM